MTKPEDVRMFHRFRFFLAVMGLAVGGLAGAAFATAPHGLTSTPPVRAVAGPLDSVHDLIEVETHQRQSADVATATLTFAPGGSSGWHHHPGVVLVVVESGTITFYNSRCRGIVHRAGTAFVEDSDTPELAKNHGKVNAVVHATYIVPTSKSATPTPLRIDDPQPATCKLK